MHSGNMNVPIIVMFWYVTLTLLTNDLGIEEKVLPQGIHMWNMKAILDTIQKFFFFLSKYDLDIWLWPQQKIFTLVLK